MADLLRYGGLLCSGRPAGLLRSTGRFTPEHAICNYYHQRMCKENPQKPDNGMTIFERRIQIACSDLGVTMTRPQIEDTSEALLAVWDKYAILDPVCIPLLDSLNKHGIKMALISNFDHPKHIHNLVRNTGIDQYFSSVIVSGDHGIKKPDTFLFQLALEKTGMESRETAYIGDSEEDIVGANNAGLTSVLIDRNGHGRDYGQKCTINTLNDVLKLTVDK